jgi:nitrile hydratase accessory protein
VNQIELDLDGPAAPPRANGEMVFEHPWQSRVFATTVALCESGAIDFDEFRRHLIAEIGEHPDNYWSSWQDALEAVLVARQLCDPDVLSMRARQFSQHSAHSSAPPPVVSSANAPTSTHRER